MPITKLTKILLLESETYEDRAVFGGLGRYADTWLQQARSAFGPAAAPWVQAVADCLRGYSRLADRAARREALAELLAVLEGGPSASSSKPPQSRVPARPVPSPSVSRTSASPPEAVHERTGLDSSVTALRGVGSRQAQRLARLGVHTIRDMVYLLPRRYDDYSQLKPINRLE